MKIEKVSDTQLKLTLTKADLAERDIQLEDLIRPGEKTQQLFRDLMEQVMEECDFVTENTPLMVEAVPVGLDGIMIIVTKVDNKDKQKGDTVLDLFSQAKDLRRFKKKSLSTEETENKSDSDILVYSFAQLDDVIDVSMRLDARFCGDSSLYKNEGRYFLVLQGNTYTAEETLDDLEVLLDEYGERHVSTPLAKYFLNEHGDVLIADHAVSALGSNFKKY